MATVWDPVAPRADSAVDTNEKTATSSATPRTHAARSAGSGRPDAPACHLPNLIKERPSPYDPPRQTPSDDRRLANAAEFYPPAVRGTTAIVAPSPARRAGRGGGPRPCRPSSGVGPSRELRTGLRREPPYPARR